jgi:hypothetical protein
MARAPLAQLHPGLGGLEGDLRGEFLGHLHMPWEPLGPQELLVEAE